MEEKYLFRYGQLEKDSLSGTDTDSLGAFENRVVE